MDNPYLLDAAYESCGMYPKSINGVDRTEWQTGWNDAIMAICTRRGALEKWFKDLGPIHKKAVMVLLKAGALHFSDRDGVGEMWLVMNDTFAYACADGETVPDKDLEEVMNAYNKFSHHGLTAWAARRRGIQPLVELQSDEYHKAMKWLARFDEF